MFYRVVFFCWPFLLDLAAVSRLTKDEKVLEIMVVMAEKFIRGDLQRARVAVECSLPWEIL